MLGIILAAALGAQGTARPASRPGDPAAGARRDPPVPAVLDFARDGGVVLAYVDGRRVKLADLAGRLARYDPGLPARWRRPEGARELNGPDLPQLLWQYVDVLCLEAEARAAGRPLADLASLTDRLLTEDFRRRFLPAYERRMRRKPDPDSIPDLRRHHRRRYGLAMEVQALLGVLVPAKHKTSEVRSFYYAHGDWFGGKVKAAHILVSLRDERTGRLLQGRRRAEAESKLRTILTTLRSDGSNFGAVAAQYSDDGATRGRDGLIGWIERFEDKLPAVIVRTAWSLPDGGISKPVRSWYGWHIVRRIKFVQNHFILPGPKQMPAIRAAMAKAEREDFLYEVRRRHERIFRL